MPSLDIRTGVQVAALISAFIAVVSLVSGIHLILKSRNLQFFKMRHDRMVTGYRRVFTAIVLGLFTWLVSTYAEPVAYTFIEPSPTATITPSITLTPTITLTPSITLTPTNTNTPSESYTPTVTPTPHIPLAIAGKFTGTLTPPAEAVFSIIEFSNIGLDGLNRPLDPTTTFTNPVGSMYAAFSYNGLLDGIQWTALWYRQNELVSFETKPWDGGTGGYGFTDWHPKAEEWLPGEYQVQVFLGYDWYQVNFFTVYGNPPAPTPTLSPTPKASATPSGTPTPTATPGPSATPTLPPGTQKPTRTPYPTRTPVPTWTLGPTITPSPTITRHPTATPLTPTVTNTRWPTKTPTPKP